MAFWLNRCTLTCDELMQLRKKQENTGKKTEKEGFKTLDLQASVISATTQQIPLGIFITISFVPQDVALIR